MEQGSSSAKSPSTSSNQRKQSYTDELRAIINSSSHDLYTERESRLSIPETSEYPSANFEGALNFSQSKQKQQIGPSFSRAPLQEEMQQSQFQGANNVDISAAYLHGNQQLYQENQFGSNNNNYYNNSMITGEEQAQYYNEMMMNRYNLSLSNLPQDFHMLQSSSGQRGLQIGSSQTLVPFESSMIDPSLNTSMHNAYSVPDNSLPLRSMRSSTQGFPYTMSTAPSSFDLGIDMTNNARTPAASALLRAPYDQSSMNEPLFDVAAQNNASAVEPSLRLSQGINDPYAMNTTPSGFNLGNGNASSSAAGPSSSALMRKMAVQEHETPNYQSWNSVGRSLHRYSSSSYDGGRYTLYDKRYEDVGLPVDPHLRIFVASNSNGSGESSSRTKD